jgi:hypothetical protein
MTTPALPLSPRTFGLIGVLDLLIGFDRAIELAQKVFALVDTLPTTPSRVVVTLGAFIGTAVIYLHSSTWVPAESWLFFLAGMSGLDLAQFHLKRTTDANYVAAKAEAQRLSGAVTPPPEVKP